MEPSPFLTHRQAAAYLRLSPRTLERSRLAGTGPRFVKAGRRVLYRREDLTAFIEGRLLCSTSDAVMEGRS